MKFICMLLGHRWGDALFFGFFDAVHLRCECKRCGASHTVAVRRDGLLFGGRVRQ